MKIKMFLLTLFCSMIFLVAPPVMAESPMHTMADILMNLNHYPGDAEKKILKQIINNSANPEDVRVLAAAILNINHKVGADDKTRLRRIIDNTATPANVRNMAEILLNLNHKATPDDKIKLQQLMH